MKQLETTARWNTHGGLAAVALATLMYEILLTRVFSVTMWYHFAFLAVSAAMFGMTVGAMLVYLLPGLFSEARLRSQLVASSLLFGVTVVLGFAAQLRIHFREPDTVRAVLAFAGTYLIVSLPFVLSGICVCLCLTRFPNQVGRLYAADLTGAALGCILLIFVLRATNASTAMVLVGVVAALGSVFFAATGPERLKRLSAAVCILLAIFAVAHGGVLGARVASAARDPLRIRWVKGAREGPLLYERWNSFSRVTVGGYADTPGEPFGWGLSPTYNGGRKVRQLYLTIDAGAGTVLTSFEGAPATLDYLRYDVSNIVHHLRPNAAVLVVGTGGGRDILSALAFGQRSTVGVEINGNIISAVNKRFGDFTGHLDRYANVRFVNDEARSYIARQTAQFDVIQISLIDTWAATAAGALTLTENSLYTVEAWGIFLDHLRPEGVLSVSRWYPDGAPVEAYRLTSLAAASLLSRGSRDPRKHIMVVRSRHHDSGGQGVGTLLMCRNAYSEADIDTIEQVAARMRFDVALSPRNAADTIFLTVAAGSMPDPSATNLLVDFTPPNDDRPFFFNTVGIRELLNLEVWRPGPHMTTAYGAVVLLGVLLGVVGLLTLFCIIVPLFIRTDRAALRNSAALTGFFLAIGLGFMLVEISQMQRLIIFLGHPTYALSVVLFALLLSGGIGSYWSRRFWEPDRPRRAALPLAGLLAALLAFGQLTPHLARSFWSSETPVRIGLAVAILFPLGLLMGMAFPLGMRLASRQSPSLMPWFWGINGAASVCASLAAVAISLYLGISAAFWAGAACYAWALASLLLAARSGVLPAPPQTVPLTTATAR